MRTRINLPSLEVTFSMQVVHPETWPLTSHSSTTSATIKASFALKWASKNKQMR